MCCLNVLPVPPPLSWECWDFDSLVAEKKTRHWEIGTRSSCLTRWILTGRPICGETIGRFSLTWLVVPTHLKSISHWGS